MKRQLYLDITVRAKPETRDYLSTSKTKFKGDDPLTFVCRPGKTRDKTPFLRKILWKPVSDSNAAQKTQV
jgi:hypothetical protein